MASVAIWAFWITPGCSRGSSPGSEASGHGCTGWRSWPVLACDCSCVSSRSCSASSCAWRLRMASSTMVSALRPVCGSGVAASPRAALPPPSTWLCASTCAVTGALSVRALTSTISSVEAWGRAGAGPAKRQASAPACTSSEMAVPTSR
ncbi:Uncharacterised protein [Bordetella pertussis]|nr:Uncharacterised protein [Bordetella pertussis]